MMHGYWDIDCDRQNFCHFEPFFCPFTPLTTQKIKILKKWNKNLEISSIYTCVLQMTIIWCTDHDIHIFLSFWVIFCPFTPLTTLKIKILNKWKKTPGDIINLSLRTTNDDHMYGSWDTECNRQKFFVILDQFLLFYPPKNPENQNFEKMIKGLEISSFYTSVP